MIRCTTQRFGVGRRSSAVSARILAFIRGPAMCQLSTVTVATAMRCTWGIFCVRCGLVNTPCIPQVAASPPCESLGLQVLSQRGLWRSDWLSSSLSVELKVGRTNTTRTCSCLGVANRLLLRQPPPNPEFSSTNVSWLLGTREDATKQISDYLVHFLVCKGLANGDVGRGEEKDACYDRGSSFSCESFSE